MSQPTIAVLNERSTSHSKRLDHVEDRVEKLTSRVDVLGARLAVYTAIGACVGGGVVAGLLRLIFPT